MFDIGWGKVVIIALVALIVIGPKELPAVLRTLGQWMTKIRRMAAEFQGQFQEAMREAEMADLKKHVDDINQATSNLGSGFDPIETAQKEIERTMEQKPATPGDPPSASSAITPGATASVADSHGAAAPAGESALPPVDLPVVLPEPLPPVTSTEIAGVAEPAPTHPASAAGGGRPA